MYTWTNGDACTPNYDVANGKQNGFGEKNAIGVVYH